MAVIDWDIEIRDAEDKFRLPYGLIRSIIITESNGDPWAIRYEPAFKSAYLDGKTWKVFGAVSHETEVMSRATSWGLMQVMGQVARERGFDRPFLSALCNPGIGIDYGCRQLKLFEQRYFDQHGWPGVIAAYNAGSPRFDVNGDWVNAGYVNKVRSLWA
jgi:soluble lytic murein transglycosylase-like protein